MRQQIKMIKECGQILDIQLVDQDVYDPALLPMIQNDDYCITPIVHAKDRISYPYEQKVPLLHFLDQYVFEDQEGYAFLIALFEKAIAANRTKPVLLDVQYVYTLRDGSDFFFVVVPLKMDHWLYRKEDCLDFVRMVAKHFRTHSDYEIVGYLHTLIDQEEFSLPNLVLGLKAIQRKYHPKKWYEWFNKKEKETFIAREEVAHYQIEIEETRSASREEKIIHTQIIGMVEEDNPYLLSEDGQKIELMFDQMLVGRALSCQIHLEQADISLNHAKITKMDRKCYIQDLKSSNGTFLNEKRVQRKMRLRNGMKVIFGSQEFIFYE